MATPGKLRAAGISWYRREDYARLRALMVDGDSLPETFEKFLYRAQKQEEEARRAGIAVIRVHLDADEFPAFCRLRGLHLDAQGRAAYASYVAARMFEEQGRGNA